MSRRLLILSAFVGLLPLAGCGNNAPKSGSTSGNAAAAAGTGTASTVPGPGQPAGGGTLPSGTHPGGHHPGASNSVEFPASYTLNPSHTLSPTTVSAPKSVPIVLTVVSRDARPATVVILANPPRTLNVPASGRGTARLGVLRPSTYTVTVDGIPRARLIVGVQPGP